VTETLILRELLAAEPGWVSGGAIASKLGVSRVSVWHQMEKLRSQGFAF
jgi:biotin operon repressor